MLCEVTLCWSSRSFWPAFSRGHLENWKKSRSLRESAGQTRQGGGGRTYTKLLRKASVGPPNLLSEQERLSSVPPGQVTLSL